MDIAVISIVVLRLTVPLLIVRLPFTGLLCAAAVDVIDFSFIGSYSWYQPVDKLLDLYYLSFCLFVSLKTWPDVIARHLAVSLFAWRLLGVGILLVGAPEWLLVAFPNLFEMLFGFYILYRRWSRRPGLFRSGRDIAIILTALAIPKLLQEYSLHAVAFLSPPLSSFMLPSNAAGVALWLAAPLVTLGWYIQHRRLPSAPFALRSRIEAMKHHLIH